ncbi:3-isopropylmalate dehydrogenase [Flavobacterium flevense]|uniref:3-isopropylmalate dehydrogenase n=1 Tax=Flavobacterium flevense TaxID=983 RepID=A0A4Y4AQJ0_9FLAO|nr:3-isopropylmalate dehydrogenase [Flavobacterium flevense]GEC70508.1 3-isopropylmalate dehydrogenase [Flavobacterium flevense]SHL62384.1 3-isopropylmalate dehydrogenase [Flavobacterium flevense]
MNLKIAVLSGDGIGPEVILQAKKALYAIGVVYEHDFIFEDAFIGAIAIDKTGSSLPEQTLNLCRNTDAVLLGAIGDPKYGTETASDTAPENGLLKLRKELGLFANIRPLKPFKGLLDVSPLKREIVEGVDFVIYRELTAGIYFGEKKLNESGTIASDLCEYSEDEITRIAHLAFQSAQKRRKKLTLVDMANVLESSRLWRKVVKKISEGYPDVALDFLFADNAAKQIISNPKQFDVILTGNLFGDMLSDEASVITGSIGVLASASLGEKNALFEPVHGSYPHAKGRNIANPFAAILSAAMLLEHFGLTEEAKKINQGVEKAIEYNVVTIDLNPDTKFGTNEVGEFISNFILNKDDLMYFNNDNVHLGQSTIV